MTSFLPCTVLFLIHAFNNYGAKFIYMHLGDKFVGFVNILFSKEQFEVKNRLTFKCCGIPLGSKLNKFNKGLLYRKTIYWRNMHCNNRGYKLTMLENFVFGESDNLRILQHEMWSICISKSDDILHSTHQGFLEESYLYHFKSIFLLGLFWPVFLGTFLQIM